MTGRVLIKSNPEVVRMPLFADIVEEQDGGIQGQRQPGLTKAALLEADPNDRQGLLETYLAQQVARELMLPLNELDISQPLTMLGFDSLMAVILRNQIERDLDIAVPMVKLLEGHSISVLATLIEAIYWSARGGQGVGNSRMEDREIIDI